MKGGITSLTRDEETEAQRGQVTCLTSYGWDLTPGVSEFKSTTCQLYLFLPPKMGSLGSRVGLGHLRAVWFCLVFVL